VAILADKSTRAIVQGITGREGEFHTRLMLAYGTQIVSGVTPGKAGQDVQGVPVFDTVAEAVQATGATATCIFVPARFAPDAILEAAEAGLKLAVVVTEGIPAQDAMRAFYHARGMGMRIIGPNGPGLITPGQCKLGIIPGDIAAPGPVGVVSRSGTLTYEIVASLTRNGLGQSTCVGVGGDALPGSTFADILPLFEADLQTQVVVLIGEIGGSDEEVAAEHIATMSKPVVAFVSGRTAPPGKRMGHAGAIISGGRGTAQAKVEAFERAGVPVAETPAEMPGLVKKALERSKKNQHSGARRE
jgi:succinyl-CoA synthetase alpha subunit